MMKQGALTLAIQNADTEEVLFNKSQVSVDNAWELQQDWMDEFFNQELQTVEEGAVRNYNVFSKFPVQVTGLPTPPQPDIQKPRTPAGSKRKNARITLSRFFFRLIQYTILLVMIFGLSIWQYNGFSLDSLAVEPTEESITLLAIMALAMGVLGTYIGTKEKVAIFTSKFDIFITGLAIIITIFCFADFEDPTAAEAFQILSMPLNALFIWLSFRANNSLLKMLLVMPSKVVCVAVTVLVGLFSVVAASAAIEAVKEKKYGEAAAMGASSAAAGAGFVSLTKFLKSLIKKSKKSCKNVT